MPNFVRVYTGDDGKSHIEDMTQPFESFVDTEGAYGEATPFSVSNAMPDRSTEQRAKHSRKGVHDLLKWLILGNVFEP